MTASGIGVKGFSPDGDSIRFEADNPANWDFFAWKKQRNKQRVKKQLRLEAIDALETHYKGLGQPRAFAIAALERMLDLLGISDVVYNILVTKIDEANDKVPGFIISAALDVFDRPVCFAFPELGGLADGDGLLPFPPGRRGDDQRVVFQVPEKIAALERKKSPDPGPALVMRFSENRLPLGPVGQSQVEAGFYRHIPGQVFSCHGGRSAGGLTGQWA